MKKRYDNIFEQIINENNIDLAYKKSQKGKMKYKYKAILFSQNLTYNLNELRNLLISNEYQPGKYNEFVVKEPKERIIFSPEYSDKIVHHAINNILKDIYKPCYIYDSYACIENKGTHACVDKISNFMKQSYYKYGKNAYIVKMDVKKFFYTIDRSILKKIIRKKIKCKRTLNLLDKIIDNSPGEIGLPLGNLTSQLFANIYLNEIDQYCKRILKLKYYIRYADDIIVIVENKEHAVYIINNVNKYIKTTLNIELHENKSKIFPIYQGINSIGFKNYITHKLLRNDCKKKIKRKIKSFKYLYENKRITKEKIEQIVNSWHGHSKKANQYNFIIKLLKLNHYLSYDKTKIYWNFQFQ